MAAEEAEATRTIEGEMMPWKLIVPRDLKHWSPQQIKQFTHAAMSPFGCYWPDLSEHVQRLAIHEKAFAVIRMQATDAVRIDAMDELVNAMEEAAGLQ